METVFDHNITGKEFNELFGQFFKDKDDYLKNMTIESHAFFNIYELYILRNDLGKAEKYLDLSGIPIEDIIDRAVSSKTKIQVSQRFLM